MYRKNNNATIQRKNNKNHRKKVKKSLMCNNKTNQKRKVKKSLMCNNKNSNKRKTKKTFKRRYIVKMKENMTNRKKRKHRTINQIKIKKNLYKINKKNKMEIKIFIKNQRKNNAKMTSLIIS